jgi:hypothetical protein
MAVDRALYQAPQGLAALAEETPDDIEVVLPDDEDDDEIIDDEEETPDIDKFNANLAEDMDETDLTAIASELVGLYDQDLIDRREWLDTYNKGLETLGLKFEERSEPWPGACGITHPLLMESAVKFQSETIMETFPAEGPVRAKIVGKETPEKKEAAARVQADMNNELTEVMSEYRPEHERMLLGLCLAGNAFKKVYFDPALDRQTAMYVTADDIIVPYGASNLESAERVTHRMRKTKNEVKKLQKAGFYLDVDLGEPAVIMDEADKQKATSQGFAATKDNRHLLLEMHVLLDLPGYEDVDEDNHETGICLPYVVTIEKGTNKVLSIRRNYLEDDLTKTKRQHFVHYGYIPGFGFYYFGLIHLIGGHAKGATSLMRQLIDAGTLANLPGGMKAKGLRIKGDQEPVKPGEFKDVDLPSGTIKDNIMLLPYKEPSATLLLLMDKVVEDGRRFAGTADLKLTDMSAQAPVGTTLAILERVLKVISAVQARIHFAMKQEFKLLGAIIRDNTPDDYTYDPESGDKSAKKTDYEVVEIIPVSDPNAATMSQRVVSYQAVLQLSQTAPQIYNLPFLHRQMIETLGIKNASKLVPVEEDMRPCDPVSENMNILMSKPAKAFMQQDHEAHLQVHMAAMQDPKLLMILSQNPNAQSIQAAAMAHVMEHTAFQYRREIEKMLGAALPPMPEADGTNALPPEIEVQLSQLAAQAASKLLQKDIAEAQVQEAAAQAQDPLLAMQQKDLEIKDRETQRKMMKDLADAAAKSDAHKLRQEEVAGNQALAAAKLLIDTGAKKDQMDTDRAMESARLLVDVGGKKDQADNARESEDKRMAADMQKHSSSQEHDLKKTTLTLKNKSAAKPAAKGK